MPASQQEKNKTPNYTWGDHMKDQRKEVEQNVQQRLDGADGFWQNVGAHAANFNDAAGLVRTGIGGAAIDLGVQAYQAGKGAVANFGQGASTPQPDKPGKAHSKDDLPANPLAANPSTETVTDVNASGGTTGGTGGTGVGVDASGGSEGGAGGNANAGTGSNPLGMYKSSQGGAPAFTNIEGVAQKTGAKAYNPTQGGNLSVVDTSGQERAHNHLAQQQLADGRWRSAMRLATDPATKKMAMDMRNKQMQTSANERAQQQAGIRTNRALEQAEAALRRADTPRARREAQANINALQVGGIQNAQRSTMDGVDMAQSGQQQTEAEREAEQIALDMSRQQWGAMQTMGNPDASQEDIANARRFLEATGAIDGEQQEQDARWRIGEMQDPNNPLVTNSFFYDENTGQTRQIPGSQPPTGGPGGFGQQAAPELSPSGQRTASNLASNLNRNYEQLKQAGLNDEQIMAQLQAEAFSEGMSPVAQAGFQEFIQSLGGG